MQTSLVTPYIFAALVVILAANSGLTESLGAHPFWAISVAWIGVPIGLVLALAAKTLQVAWLIRVLIFLICVSAAYTLAAVGKERFAASYAEDRFAGQIWYFGWIASTCAATALIAAIFSPTHARSKA